MQEVCRGDESNTDDQTHSDEDQHSTSEVFPLEEEGAANEMRIQIGLHARHLDVCLALNQVR